MPRLSEHIALVILDDGTVFDDSLDFGIIERLEHYGRVIDNAALNDRLIIRLVRECEAVDALVDYRIFKSVACAIFYDEVVIAILVEDRAGLIIHSLCAVDAYGCGERARKSDCNVVSRVSHVFDDDSFHLWLVNLHVCAHKDRSRHQVVAVFVHKLYLIFKRTVPARVAKLEYSRLVKADKVAIEFKLIARTRRLYLDLIVGINSNHYESPAVYFPLLLIGERLS